LRIDFSKLAEKTDGFSSADIETVVKDTIEKSFIENLEVSKTDNYLKSVKETISISEMLPKQIKKYEDAKKELKLKLVSKVLKS